MRNKKIIKIVIPLLTIIIGTYSFATTQKIVINEETFTFDNKNKNIASKFDNNYEITDKYTDENLELKQTITELTKKTTYLLLGEERQNKESSENYYKRHQDYLNLRYNPEVPKDENSILGLDQNSQEYKDDILSGMSVPGMFSKLNELEVKYHSYGEIRVSIINDELIISDITLPSVTMKEQNEKEPRKYDIIQTDLTMHYYYKKLNDEYKLLYLYGETNDEIAEYMEKNDEKIGDLSKDSDYNSQLEDIYDFSKAKNITDNKLKEIYESNKSNIVYLNSIYNTGIVTTANGFFIKEGIIATTYNYIENSLMKAQKIIISDSSGNVYELEGIVTINIENDIAILKLKNQNQNYIELKENIQLQKEDAVITLNSKTGVGLSTSKGIITAIDKNIQTSLPVTEEIQGSPVFNANGELIGMINSKAINTSISFATNIDIIKKYYQKFNEKNYENIKAIPFQELKENYYIKYNNEKEINDISEKKWEEPLMKDVKDTINLKLIKGTYKNKIVSLRYKNDISNYIDTRTFSKEYEERLKSQGYIENNVSDFKTIYTNNKYQIIIMKEFDYLIIVMVEL